MFDKNTVLTSYTYYLIMFFKTYDLELQHYTF